MIGTSDSTPQRPDPRVSNMQRGRRRLRIWRQAKFLRAFRETGDLRGAADAAGISPWTAAHWKRTDSDFAEAFSQAEDVALLELETTARKRALEGSDRLLIFLLERRWPRRYGSRAAIAARMEVVGDEARTVAVEMRAVWEELENFCPPADDEAEAPVARRCGSTNVTVLDDS
jgi:hypothetical protein